MFNKIKKLSSLVLIPLTFSFSSIVKNNLSSLEKFENKQLKVNSNNNSNQISTNAVNWLWKGSNQNVKKHTEDFSLTKIASGWYEVGNLFFHHIEVEFEKENYTKTINFDIDNIESQTNVYEFSIKLINLGTTYTKMIFGKEYKNHKLNINFDSTFRFQTDDKSNLYNNVTPIMFGNGFNHDPRYIGRVFIEKEPNWLMRFEDVHKQTNICEGYRNQCRDAFSQNLMTNYIPTTSIYGLSGYHYEASNTFDLLNKIWSKYADSSTSAISIWIDFQVDIWFIRNTWYVGLFWINNF